MTALDWFKIIAPLLTGGLVGAVTTAIITNRRSRIQPISRRLAVSYVNLPAIMQGYDAVITLSGTTGDQPESHHFARLAIIQLELTNAGNKDLEKFEFGINLPTGTNIISVQNESQDRYHLVSYTPEIKIRETSDQLDFVFTPFNRGDNYKITLVASTTESDLLENIKLSTRLPVKFVDADAIYKTALQIAGEITKSLIMGLPIPILKDMRTRPL